MLKEPCRDGAGDTARATGCRTCGRGDTARKFDPDRVAGPGEGVSRLSVDDLFIDENGLCVFTLPFGELRPLAFNRSRAAAAGFGAPAAA